MLHLDSSLYIIADVQICLSISLGVIGLAEVRAYIGTHTKDWQDEYQGSHREVEVTMILEGSGLFRHTDKEMKVEAGQVVLIPSGILHSFHAITPIRFGVLIFDGLPSQVEEWFHRLIVDGLPRIISLSRLDQEQYERLFREWLRVRSSILKEPLRLDLVWAELLLLFLNEHIHTDRQALSIAHIGDYIRQHLHEAIQVSSLADMAGLSEDGFRKRFSKVYGMTPKQYQQQCRLTEAKWLLSSSDKDMQAIANLVGFVQLHSFSLWFKRLENIPPSEWRNHQRLNHH